jgi:hypothetical protein
MRNLLSILLAFIFTSHSFSQKIEEALCYPSLIFNTCIKRSTSDLQNLKAQHDQIIDCWIEKDNISHIYIWHCKQDEIFGSAYSWRDSDAISIFKRTKPK